MASCEGPTALLSVSLTCVNEPEYKSHGDDSNWHANFLRQRHWQAQIKPSLRKPCACMKVFECPLLPWSESHCSDAHRCSRLLKDTGKVKSGESQPSSVLCTRVSSRSSTCAKSGEQLNLTCMHHRLACLHTSNPDCFHQSHDRQCAASLSPFAGPKPADMHALPMCTQGSPAASLA